MWNDNTSSFGEYNKNGNQSFTQLFNLEESDGYFVICLQFWG